MSFIFSNGIFLPEGEGVVSVNDRSFRFGDGVFETVAVFGGKIYQREFHVQRLHASLAALRINGVDASAVVESATQEQYVRDIFDSIEDFTNITFTEASTTSGTHLNNTSDISLYFKTWDSTTDVLS